MGPPPRSHELDFDQMQPRGPTGRAQGPSDRAQPRNLGLRHPLLDRQLKGTTPMAPASLHFDHLQARPVAEQKVDLGRWAGQAAGHQAPPAAPGGTLRKGFAHAPELSAVGLTPCNL